MSKIHLEIVTPEGRVYADDVDTVVIPGIEGELGILPQHVPLMTRILPGELTVFNNAHKVHLAIGEGFVEITQTRISILADMAIKEEDIDESAVEVAIRRAEESMQREDLDTEDLARVQATLQKSLVQLRVKKRR